MGRRRPRHRVDGVTPADSTRSESHVPLLGRLDQRFVAGNKAPAHREVLAERLAERDGPADEAAREHLLRRHRVT